MQTHEYLSIWLRGSLRSLKKKLAVRNQIVVVALLWSSVLQAQISASEYDNRLEKAVGFYADKKFSEASVLLESLTRDAPERKEAFLWLGNARSQMQNWSGATEAYKTYVGMAPGDADGFRGLAGSYEAQDQTDLAKLYYKKALDLEPGNQGILQALQRINGTKPPLGPSSDSSATPPDASPDVTGFWHVGLAGVCKARTVWWGRLLAILFFGMSLLHGAFAGAKTIKERFPNVPPAFYFINALIASSLSYILFWGIPEGWGWGLLAACALFSATAGTKVLTET